MSRDVVLTERYRLTVNGGYLTAVECPTDGGSLAAVDVLPMTLGGLPVAR